MKTLKKSLAVLLALVMSLGCMSVGVWADTYDPIIQAAIEEYTAEGKTVVTVDTAEALQSALDVSNNDTAILITADISKTADITAPYGNKIGFHQAKGGIIDGCGHTISVEGSGDVYAIMTKGGSIKNLTIDEGFRAIVSYTPTQDIILDNVCMDGATKSAVGYAFNTAEHGRVKLIATNCTFRGWTSFAGLENATFSNCHFEQGTYYGPATSAYGVYGRLVRPYVSTLFEKCDFVNPFYVDLSALASGEVVVFAECTVADTQVTSKNLFTIFEEVEAGTSENVKVAVAQVGDNYYTTLAEAIDAAQNGDTITLLADAPLNDTLTISKAITIDGQGLYKIHPNTPSYFENKSSEQTAASSSKNLITVQSNGVTLKNLTVESRAFSRYEIGVDQGYTATLDNVVTDHTDHSSRGNDSIQLNGGLVVKNNLTVKIGASLRYFDDRGNKASDAGIVAQSWGGISFNGDNCSIHFEEGATFNGVNAYNEKLGVYGQSQAMIHLYRSTGTKDSDIAAAFAQVTGSIPSNLVKVIGNSWDMTGYEVAGSKFLTDNYAYVVTSATGTNVYYQSLDKAYAALKSGDTIIADPTGKLPSDCVAIDNGNGTWTVKSAVDLAKESKETTEAGKEDAGYTATTDLTLGTAVTNEETQETKGTVTVNANDTIKYVAEADATSGTGDNQTTGSASEVVITSGTTKTTAYVVTNAEGTTTAIKSGNIGNEVTGKSEDGDLLTKENYAELFDMPAVLANLAAETSTPVTDVTITMYAEAAAEEDLANVNPTEHDATYEVHPVASVGNDSFEVTDPDMLKADSYNVKMYVDAQYAGKNLRLTHYLANGGTEDLGVYPVKTEVVNSETKYYVEYAMTSFSVVGINTTDSSYVLSITDTEAAYNSTGDDQTVVAGQTVTMQVKVTDAGDDSAKFIYADGTISYDDDLFELVSCTPVTDWYFLANDSASNTGKISFKVRASSDVYQVASGSAIMTLVFKAKSGVSGNGAFALTNATAAKVADTEGNAITASTYGDAVKVEKTYTAVVTKANGGQVTTYVKADTDFEYAITPYDASYTYQVTATVNGNPVPADKISVDEAGKITIDKSAITGVLRVSISAFEVNVYSDYVTGYYLVTVTDQGNNGSAAYSFNDSEMYNITRTSDASKYSAYLIKTTAAGALLEEGESEFTKDVAVRYVAKAATAAGELSIPTLDVNGTGTVDQNDYLRVFVCYEVAAGASVESRMADWLRADYDGNNKVNSVDFAQVYNAING